MFQDKDSEVFRRQQGLETCKARDAHMYMYISIGITVVKGSKLSSYIYHMLSDEHIR